MTKIVLIYEANAVPFLQSLLQSDTFKFPLKFTIADISPCKTCFLLNQEVKQCRDYNISLLKEKGQKQDYYSQLLAFHGLLKSFECFIHFDVQLAISNLLEFEERHLALLKNCYDSIAKTFKSEMNKCAEINYIHPKLREMAKFLKEKLSLVKETGHIFKVMIIIKKYLNELYKKFESVLKEEMCNIKTFLIPESVFLHENTLMFKSSEDTVFFVSPSSLAKNIPWKDLIFIIEFQHDNNSCWKHICSEKNVFHAFVQVADLPLKTLDEIQKLKNTDKASVYSVQDTVRSLIVSGSITSQYQLLYLLESRLNLSICIRQYKEILPHLHFADVAINEKSALIFVSNVSFSEDNFPETLLEKVSFLLLKYEICWIIVQEYKENLITLKHMKSNENFWKFFLLIEDLCQNSTTHKVKMLHAQSIEETLDLIKNILMRNLNNYPISFTSQISKEETFLISFPSLNPYVVQHMISECSLYEILNFTLDELLQKWCFISERFFKCFHSAVHKVLSVESDASDESLVSTPDSDHELNFESNSEFKLKPNYHKNLNDSQDFEDLEEANDNEYFLNSKFANGDEDGDYHQLRGSKKANEQFGSDKSLQELDLDYMSLKLSHEYDGYNDYLSGDGSSFNRTGYSIDKCAIVTPRKNRYQENDYSYNFESLNSQFASSNRDNDCNKFSMNARDMLENSTIATIGREPFSSSISKVPNSQNGNKSPLDLEKFMYIPKKRPFLVEDSSPNNDCVSSPALKKSCRIQKGMISKIVSKKDLAYPSTFNSQDTVFCESGNVRKAKVSPFMKSGHCFEDPDTKFVVKSNLRNDADIYFEQQQSEWPDSSLTMKSIPMTPAVRKLGYEKMPGVKGQTRLVFH
ncbi:Protein shortage in chiasmata 1 like protein [Argiope bruennichi]|uniref:Protein shortage in chiasmata 1 like protein n=2 Tax=Argiope bruennichi TaxID=94029 RepID=A0A8T0E761_ARGBR|nr:Protein shortage in chiasmata 1 like protein [Argiope bruennichi]